MNRVLYRIYTEDKNREKVEFLCSRLLSGFTLLSGRGYWNGVGEPTLIIEVEGSETTRIIVERIATEIKRLNTQESVLVTSQPVEVTYI